MELALRFTTVDIVLEVGGVTATVK